MRKDRVRTTMNQSGYATVDLPGAVHGSDGEQPRSQSFHLTARECSAQTPPGDARPSQIGRTSHSTAGGKNARKIGVHAPRSPHGSPNRAQTRYLRATQPLTDWGSRW